MQEKIYMIKDYAKTKILYLMAEDGVDMDARLEEAKQLAISDGVKGMFHEIPKKYLEKVGLYPKEIPVVYCPDTVLAVSKMEKAGIHFAECRDCDAFEEGSCYRYGGICNPSTENDCCHGYNIYELSYEDIEYEFRRILYIDNENPNAEETAKIIQEEIPEVKEILESDYEPECWMIHKKQ